MRHETAEGSVYFDLHRWYVQSDSEHSANFQFFGAAPAMADAILAFVTACDTAPPIDLLRHLSECRAKAGEALKLAGYVEALPSTSAQAPSQPA